MVDRFSMRSPSTRYEDVFRKSNSMGRLWKHFDGRTMGAFQLMDCKSISMGDYRFEMRTNNLRRSLDFAKANYDVFRSN